MNCAAAIAQNRRDGAGTGRGASHAARAMARPVARRAGGVLAFELPSTVGPATHRDAAARGPHESAHAGHHTVTAVRRKSPRAVPWVAVFAGVVLAGLSLGGGADRAHAEVAAPASQAAVARMADTLDALSARDDLATHQRAAAFLAAADRHFDIATMARDALGTERFAALDAGARAAYLAAFRGHLAHGFADAVARYGPSTTTLLGSRVAASGQVVVIGRGRTGAGTRELTWIMCRRDRTRICDVEAGGVRASARQRAEIARVLERAGFDGLLADLRSGALAERLQ